MKAAVKEARVKKLKTRLARLSTDFLVINSVSGSRNIPKMWTNWGTTTAAIVDAYADTCVKLMDLGIDVNHAEYGFTDIVSTSDINEEIARRVMES